MDQYAEAIELIKASELFDAKWYGNRYPDVTLLSMDPVKHYVKIGFLLHRDPGPNFSTLGYLQAYPDVEKSGLNPLFHYVKMGKSEGRLAPMSRSAWEDRGFARAEIKTSSGRAGAEQARTEGPAVIKREAEQELAKSKKECLALAEENELLLLQLHQAQEELEEYFLKYQALCPPTDKI